MKLADCLTPQRSGGLVKHRSSRRSIIEKSFRPSFPASFSAKALQKLLLLLLVLLVVVGSDVVGSDVVGPVGAASVAIRFF